METSTKWILGGVGVAAVAAYVFWPKTAMALPAGAPAWLPKGIPSQKAYNDYHTVGPVDPPVGEQPKTLVAWNLTKNVPQTFVSNVDAFTVSSQELTDLKNAGITGTIFYANDGTGTVGRFFTPILFFMGQLDPVQAAPQQALPYQGGSTVTLIPNQPSVSLGFSVGQLISIQLPPGAVWRSASGSSNVAAMDGKNDLFSFTYHDQMRPDVFSWTAADNTPQVSTISYYTSSF